MEADTFDRDLQKRLRFIEGQARGVQGMVKEGRDIADVLTQLLAIQSAARSAAELIIRDRLNRRIKETIQCVVLNCAEQCDMCDELEGLSQALDQLDYPGLLEDVTKLR